MKTKNCPTCPDKICAVCGELPRDCRCSSRHTPTLAIISKNATHIAFVNGPTVERAQALRAVNAHEELLDMVYRAIPYLEEITKDPLYKPGAVAETIRKMKQAIAKAEGRHE